MSMELTEKELSQISGGAPGGSSGSIKGWVCKNCGHIQGTWQEVGGVMLTPSVPIICDNCGSQDSFEKRDI